jgi:hypothetical protein
MQLLISLSVSAIFSVFAFTSLAQNVGIGVPSPTSRLDIVGTGSTFATASLKVSNSLGANIMYVRDDGFVGINNTSPGSALDVKGTLRISGSTAGFVGLSAHPSAGYITYTLPAADGSSGQVLSTDGAGNLYWGVGGGGGTGFNLNCGTTSNSEYVIRGTGSGNWECTNAIRISSSGYVAINSTTSSSYRLRVTGTTYLDGNVGINTTPSSSYKLNVNGDTYISSGGLGVGATNTSNGTIRTSGGVGIGTSPPSSGLYVGGSSNFYVPTSISTTSTAVNVTISSGRIYRYSSSMRYKDNIDDMAFTSEVKEKVLQIRPRTFTDKTTGLRDFGLIAEEVEQILPFMVIYEPVPLKNADGSIVYDAEGYPVVSKTEKTVEGVKYDRFSIYLLEIIKEHESVITSLQKTVELQNSAIERLETQVNALTGK